MTESRNSFSVIVMDLRRERKRSECFQCWLCYQCYNGWRAHGVCALKSSSYVTVPCNRPSREPICSIIACFARLHTCMKFVLLFGDCWVPYFSPVHSVAEAYHTITPHSVVICFSEEYFWRQLMIVNSGINSHQSHYEVTCNKKSSSNTCRNGNCWFIIG